MPDNERPTLTWVVSILTVVWLIVQINRETQIAERLFSIWDGIVSWCWATLLWLWNLEIRLPIIIGAYVTYRALRFVYNRKYAPNEGLLGNQNRISSHLDYLARTYPAYRFVIQICENPQTIKKIRELYENRFTGNVDGIISELEKENALFYDEDLGKWCTSEHVLVLLEKYGYI